LRQGCIKTGNSLILKGGSEASHSNAVIALALQSALEETGMPTGCLELMAAEQGVVIRDLVTQDQYLNLVIPYGRPSGAAGSAAVNGTGSQVSYGQLLPLLVSVWQLGYGSLDDYR